MDTLEMLDWGVSVEFARKAIADVQRVDTHMAWKHVDLSVRACVARGVRHLRRLYPALLSSVSLLTLDMRECRYCVLGQMLGDYSWTWEHQTLTHPWLIAHGFVPTFDSLEDYDPTAAGLTAEWQRQLDSDEVATQ